MRIKLDPNMVQFYIDQLHYAQQRKDEMKRLYNNYKVQAYMEDNPCLCIQYTAWAEITHDSYLFWLSQELSIQSKLK